MHRTLGRLALLMLLIVLVAGCGGATTPTAVPAATVAPTAVPATEAPTEAAPTEAPTEVAPTDTPAPEPTATEAAAEEAATDDLILATTTSTYDSGLLDYLLPDFEQQYGVSVSVVAVGTGQAITLGEDGNADVLLVHARALEDAFMEAGHGVRREDVMYNDFVIVGPEDDPAGIKGMTNAADAMAKIASSESTFISRGDNSGTNVKELAIWADAGIEPAGDWYVSAGQGMGSVLTMADEQQAYTLSDRATYLARTLEGTDLVVLTEGDPILFNPYGVIAVNPDKGPHIKADLANDFIDWIISVPTQELISQFGVDEFGQALFTPDSALWRESQGAAAETEAVAEAALTVTGLVDAEGSYALADLQAMDTMDVDYTSKGETTTYTGVPISALLDAAGVQADAATVSFVAGDGYAYDAALGDVTACANCIVAWTEDGTLRTVMPDMAGAAQVKGLVDINVK